MKLPHLVLQHPSFQARLEPPDVVEGHPHSPSHPLALTLGSMQSPTHRALSSTAGHCEACREFIEGKMETDGVLRERILAARGRRDRFLAEEVESGAEAPAAAETPGEVVEQIFEPASGSEVSEAKPHNDLIPDVGDGLDEEEARVAELFGDWDDDEPEPKRVRATSLASEAPDPEVENPEESQLEAKRARVGSMSAVVAPQLRNLHVSPESLTPVLFPFPAWATDGYAGIVAGIPPTVLNRDPQPT